MSALGLGVLMTDDLPELDPRRLAEDLRRTWQARALVETQRERIGAVVLSVLAHNFDDVMPVLMRIVFPGFHSITAPFICSAGKVNKRGHIVADIVMRDNEAPRKNRVIYRTVGNLQNDFRRLADRLSLTDSERVELFTAVRRWVVADQRRDPTLDPADPDSRRLTETDIKPAYPVTLH